MLAKGSGRVTTVIVAVNGIKGICKKEYIIYKDSFYSADNMMVYKPFMSSVAGD